MSDPSPRAADLPPSRVSPVEIPGMNALLALAVGVVVVAGLSLAREVLIPIVLAVLLSFVLAPLVSLLHRLHLGRVPAVILAVLLALAVILGVGGLIGAQVASLVSQVPRYAQTIEHKVRLVRSFTANELQTVMEGLGQHAPQPADASAAPAPGQQAQPVPPAAGTSPWELAWQYVTPVVSPLGTALVVFIFTVFILLQREDLRDRVIRLAGSRDLHRTTMAMNDGGRRLSRYFLTQLAVNTSFGVITGVGLLLIGVPSALLWGVLGLLLRFVPYIGPWIALAMPALLAAAVDPGWSMVIWTVALYGVVEFTLGQAVEPMLYGHSTGLSPFAVIVAATFWTWLWGPIGLILSTPLTLCLVVLGRHVDQLEFLDVLLGDRPALTPVQSFYQRMLAGDPDEAHEQAEQLLKERSLSSYYDEVVLKGLQLAAGDADRGVMTDQQVERVKQAALHLIDDLEDEDDTDPEADKEDDSVSTPSRVERELPREAAPTVTAPSRDALPQLWQGDTPVLCLAGRGQIDDAAAAMLAQLLRKHGLGARMLPHEAADRERILQIDFAQTAMVCICHLEITGASSRLRYMIRRLRQRAPAARIMVGLWPEMEEAAMNERLQATVGADCYARTLHEAIEQCLQTAWHAAAASAAAPTPSPPAAAAPPVAA
jgi:predicted PurR-regulated permease PerM